MLARVVNRLLKSIFCMLMLPATLAAYAGIDWILSFTDSITLPNGVVLKREFNYPTGSVQTIPS